MIKSLRIVLLSGFSMLAVNSSLAQEPSLADHTPPPVTVSPEIQSQVDLAYLLVGGLGTPEHLPTFLLSAGVFPAGSIPNPLAAQRENLVTVKGQAFDQLYYIGNSVGTWLLKTSDGIIMFDAMNSAADAENIIEPGMRELGLDPADIKFIVIMHGHADHFGGVKHFQDRYNARVLAGPRDWDTMEAPRANSSGRLPPPAPRRDMSVAEGQLLTLGDTTVRLFLTPGHTLDTVSALVPVTHNGTQHLLSFWGGTGAPRTIEPPGPGVPNMGLASYRDQLLRFTRLSIAAGADGVISNHSVVDGTLDKMARRAVLESGAENPWIMGRDGFIRWQGAFLAAVEAGIMAKRANPPPPAN